jgi:hypothetical protein
MSLKNVTPNHPFVGIWHIYDMELWDEEYFNMETQAYIKIAPNNLGDFQFGLVSGSLDGEIERIADVERFSFTWQGQDEMEEANGSGWLQLTSDNEAFGSFSLHYGDSSGFKAIRAE